MRSNGAGAVVLLLLLAGCGRTKGTRDAEPPVATPDKEPAEAAPADAHEDAVTGDAGTHETAPPEAGPPEAAPGDAESDAGTGDAATHEAAPPRHHALAIAADDTYACAIRDDGKVVCWGRDAPTIDLPPGRQARALASGGYATCAILDDGSVQCWTTSPGGLRAATFPVDLGPGRRAVNIAGHGHPWACATRDDQTVLCWDNVTRPSAGLRTRVITPIPGTAPIRQLAKTYGNDIGAVYEDGRFSAPLSLAFEPPRFLNGRSVTAMAGCPGSTYCWCVALAGGGVTCSGSPEAPAPMTELTSIAKGEQFLCGIRPGGTVTCWGFLAGCDDGLPSTSYWCDTAAGADKGHDVALGQPALAIAASTWLAVPFACALLADGGIKCWGGERPTCVSDGDGGHTCQAPEKQSEVIGGSVEIETVDGRRRYGAWRAIDLDAPP